MIKTAYHYLFYRTYEVILKTNQSSSESSSARLLSILFFINIFTVYFFLFNSYRTISFYVFIIIGVGLSILNLWYFNNVRHNDIISEFKNYKVKLAYKYLADSYPYLSGLVFLISIRVNFSTILYYSGIIVLIKLISYFWKA
ncbi:hypothetical protein [Flavobacterium pectinovorum]|uniref:ABC transporter permease n=1 Tax=Flavobacterium pectinovorum TaxID=29533 RepID=A0AB36NW92_9FLAO|nr:hypothetical protein [Flavobacterium pectinovorum]OXB00247.1 hypothetical protein B0A72_20355 [Flavobacterium pectinovorum]SHL71471.1 hypothetical protein SAMN05444387_1314 [Flavobacterium pectinovorum]